MKTLKQRFSIWYNRTHNRRGTLWTERFKSVLVEGRGNPLQTMAAYIDLNPVRAGIVKDPKNYRFCGYAEAVVGQRCACSGLQIVWSAYAGGEARGETSMEQVLQCHRELIFGHRAGDPGLTEPVRREVLKVLEKEDAILPKAAVMRCRVRYFTYGAILGSVEYVRGFIDIWQMQKGRKHPPRANRLRGADWSSPEQAGGQGLACIQGLRQSVFG